jgi:hypothetical protein
MFTGKPNNLQSDLTRSGEEPMSERIHELLLRNLQEVFGEGDSTKRRSAIKELYTDGLRGLCPRSYSSRTG